jgi:type II secretory pathway pseudopilin PulG
MNRLNTRKVSAQTNGGAMLNQPRPRRDGFTSVELLVVIVVIALFAGMLLPSLARVREKSRIAGCLRNLKQMGQGSLMYSQDFNGNLSGASWMQPFVGSVGSGAYPTDRDFPDDDLNWLYPRYIDDVNTFICPATQNKIAIAYQTNALAPYGRYLPDLCNNAVSPKGQGDSYEVYGDYNPQGLLRKKTDRETLVHEISTYAGHIGEHPGPGRTILIADADDPHNESTNQHEDFPDPGNNHGAAGTCASFCDGHAEFIPINQYLNAWNLSQDSNVTAPAP